MSTTFYALLIHLQATEDAALPMTQGHLSNAAFYALIDAVRPELAEQLHDRKGRKPFTLSPVWGLPPANKGKHKLRTRQQARLRLTLLDADLFQAFMQKLLVGPEQRIRLGRAEFLITEVRGTPEGSEWAGYTTAAELERRASAEATRLKLQFKSPMAIGVGRADSGKSKNETLPIPRFVWASLRGGWNKFSDQEIPKGFEDWVETNVVTSRVDSWQTAVFRYKRGIQVGGYGQVTYDALDSAPTFLRWWNLLADFAFYGGVGVKTGMGMGTARRMANGQL